MKYLILSFEISPTEAEWLQKSTSMVWSIRWLVIYTDIEVAKRNCEALHQVSDEQILKFHFLVNLVVCHTNFEMNMNCP